MKFKINDKKILLRNLGNDREGTCNSIEQKDVNTNKVSSEKIIKELEKIAPNKEEFETMKKEFEEIDAEILTELKKFVKPKLAFLKNEILGTPIVKELVATLQNKIKELQEAGKDTYGNMEFVVPCTQLALLNVIKQNKPANGAGTSIGGLGSSSGGNISGEKGF